MSSAARRLQSGGLPVARRVCSNASVQEEAAVFCGGALIDDGAPAASSQWVLTAAHCLVVGGERCVASQRSRCLPVSPDLTQVQPEQRHPVADIIVHPLYLSGYAPVNDIALLRLAAPVNVGNTLPVATPADAAFFAPGADAQIAGWGNLLPQTGVQQPDIAHKAVVKIVDDATCNARYDRALGIEHLCAGNMPDGGVDTCQGDSGGPLMVVKGSTLIHAGIVSFGQGCAWPHFPGVYARTATYAGWINAVINDQPHVGVTQAGTVSDLGTRLRDSCSRPHVAPHLDCCARRAVHVYAAGRQHRYAGPRYADHNCHICPAAPV
jgi:secreted trypsin-like serine protease